MNWFKKVGASIGAAFVFALAVFAAMSAQSHKNEAKKWKDKAVDIEEGNVTEGTETAKAANTQAELHDIRAKERKDKAEAKISQIADKNEEIKDILKQWGVDE